jgi:hypothetical protein
MSGSGDVMLGMTFAKIHLSQSLFLPKVLLGVLIKINRVGQQEAKHSFDIHGTLKWKTMTKQKSGS